MERFVFPHGEQHKNLNTYGQALNFLCDRRFTRSDLIIALGGGVVGDLAGFTAATYQRGIAYIQVPTTLLSMVDSSVGGKTAVDLDSGKNQAGCFYQPALVLCDPALLETLPDAEYRAGCAEIIKTAVLFSPELFQQLKTTPIREQFEPVIAACVGMKRNVVQNDEFDRGQRALLNLGHTIGHAVEACSNFTILHGEGVAIGLAAITRARRGKGHLRSRPAAAGAGHSETIRPAHGGSLSAGRHSESRRSRQKAQRQRNQIRSAGGHGPVPDGTRPGG